jgi:hypothetical protein
MVDTLTEKTCTPCKGGVPPGAANQYGGTAGRPVSDKARSGDQRAVGKG